jgi:hypothetical protein
MDAHSALTWSLISLAILGLVYRIYVWKLKDGAVADVLGQAVLAVVLVLVATGVAAEVSIARWTALVLALFFAVVVIPVWVLAVLIPSRPKALDVAFTFLYEALFIASAILALTI